MGRAAPLVAAGGQRARRVGGSQRHAFLTFDNDTRAFFSDDNPQFTALQELEDTYSKTRTVLTSSASS